MITIKSFEFNYFQENTFLLYDDTREAVLIDCGCCRKEEEKELTDFILENKLTLKHLLCTHLHVDHVFGNGFIYKTYGLKTRSEQAGCRETTLSGRTGQVVRTPSACRERPVEKYIVGGEIIKFGTSELQVLTVPGHSPGSIAFYNKKNGFAIVGDALFAGSIGRTDLWGGNQEVLVAAIHDKLLSLPDETVIYPGHGAETRVIDEKFNNPYL